jgi:YidB-like protein
MSRGFPSMTALLGLLAIAGYQNRDKIAETLRRLGQSTPEAGGQGGIGGLLSQLSTSLGGVSAGGILSGGLGELVDRFKQSGQSETAESWVKTGPTNRARRPSLSRRLARRCWTPCRNKPGWRAKSCSRDCAANSLMQSISIRRKGSRRKRNFRVRETSNGATLAETSVARSGTAST